MATPLDREIRSRLSAVLAGEVALRDFYAWFVPATLEVERTANLEAIRLTRDLAHFFAELSAGVVTRDDARRTLQEVASIYFVAATPWNRAAGKPVTMTGSNDIIEGRSASFVLGSRHEVAIA
ncbi:MAG: hypothetical protein H0V00_13675 [Chloroflexia bacterium]|nr:hypothetical protein [Chloroflexia bacterium]